MSKCVLYIVSAEMFVLETIRFRMVSSLHIYTRILMTHVCAQLCPTLYDSWTVDHKAPLFMGVPRQEYWKGLPFPSPGDLPNPGIEPVSPALQADSLPLSHQLIH